MHRTDGSILVLDGAMDSIDGSDLVLDGTMDSIDGSAFGLDQVMGFLVFLMEWIVLVWIVL